MGVRSTWGLEMVATRVLITFVLGALITISEARRPKSSQLNRSGACPTEGNKECVFPFKTACTTAKGPCKFPFLYKGKEYDECTLYQSSGGRPWCATALKADGNMQSWSACDMDVCTDPECVPTPPTTTTTTTTVATTADPSICPTEEGNDCIFPFNTVCKTDKGPCMFPFMYKGQKYTNCTLYQSSGGNPWCATTLRSDGNMQQWANCDMDVCVIPNGVVGPFGQCVPSQSSQGKGWCA